jgi:pyridoxamine 5'-phosphate oxidase
MAPAHQATDPILLFQQLLAEAQSLPRDIMPEPTAFALATVGAGGRPSIRMLLLKHVDVKGFVFYTNLESRKGRELFGNAHAAMNFFWAPMERQVRIEGDVSAVSEEEADDYFATRPRGSQIGAWASRQSAPLLSREALEERVRHVEARFAESAIPRPPYWGGYRLTPLRLELWEGRESRLHERLLFERAGGGWRSQRLWP